MTTQFPGFFFFILIFGGFFCHLAQLCACFLTLLRLRACTLGGDGDHHSTMSCCSRRCAFRSYWSILILPCLPQSAGNAAPPVRRLRRARQSCFVIKKAKVGSIVKIQLGHITGWRSLYLTNATNTLNVDIWCDTRHSFGLFQKSCPSWKGLLPASMSKAIGHGMRLQYRGHQGLGWGTHFKGLRRGDRQGWDHCTDENGWNSGQKVPSKKEEGRQQMQRTRWLSYIYLFFLLNG